MKVALISATILSAVVSSVVGAPTATASAATPTGSQIRTDQDPVYHLYLQEIGGQPILGPESSSGYFTIGSTIVLNNPTTGDAPLYFNVNTTGTTDWKPVYFSSTPDTSTWTMSGDTIVDGNTQNFVVCPISGSANFNLYLQTGVNMPSSACTNWITIHLPCLC